MENINSFQAFWSNSVGKKKRKRKKKDKKRGQGQGKVSVLLHIQYLPEDIKPVQANGFNDTVCQSTSDDSDICFLFMIVCLFTL